MPAKGSIGRFHGRHTFIEKNLWRKYCKENKSKISYSDFKKIISSSILEINKWVLREPVGFQLPGTGHIAINKFKTFGNFKTYNAGRVIPTYNFHTGGNTHRIQWFKSTRVFGTRMPFWFFKACRISNRNLAKVLKSTSSPNYNSFTQDHFIKKLPR